MITFVKSSENNSAILTENTSNKVHNTHAPKIVWDRKEVKENANTGHIQINSTGRMLKSEFDKEEMSKNEFDMEKQKENSKLDWNRERDQERD